MTVAHLPAAALPVAPQSLGTPAGTTAAPGLPAPVPDKDPAERPVPTDYIHTHGPKLIAQDYLIAPITPGSKRPTIRGWVDRDFNSEDLRRKFRGWGVGVKTGYIVGIDGDVLDPAVVEELIAWCTQQFGKAPRRIGRWPKTMLVYRTTKPFKKTASRGFRSPDGKEHRVEVLGTGQQFVAYGIHPDTGKPYSWPDGDLTEVSAGELPEITEAQALQLLAQFEKMALARGWTVVKLEELQRRAKGEGEHKPGKRQRAPLWKLDAALKVLPPAYADDYKTWTKTGMALHCATAGSPDGLGMWDEWSSQSGKYQLGVTEAKWKTFATDRQDRAGAGTIFRMANQIDRGWLKRAEEAHAQALIAARVPESYRVGDKIFNMSEVAETLRRATGAAR